MADFLDINGVPVSVADQTFTNGLLEIGERARAVDGSLVKTLVALKQKYDWTTAPLSASDAAAWKALINGYGNHWSFDSSVYSGKGLGPASLVASQVNVGFGKYGGSFQVDTNGNSTSLALFAPTGLDGFNNGFASCTVLYWGRGQDGATWTHYEIVGNTIYKNGVAGSIDGITNAMSSPGGGGGTQLQLKGYGVTANGGATIPTWLANHAYGLNALVQPTAGNGRYYKATTGGTSNASTQPTWPTTLGATVADGTVVWTDQGPLSLFIDDLVILPFVVPTSWIAPMYALCAAQAYPDCPLLYVSGLGVLNAGNMIGAVGDDTLMQAFPSGVFTQNLHKLAISLEEA